MSLVNFTRAAALPLCTFFYVIASTRAAAAVKVVGSSTFFDVNILLLLMIPYLTGLGRLPRPY